MVDISMDEGSGNNAEKTRKRSGFNSQKTKVGMKGKLNSKNQPHKPNKQKRKKQRSRNRILSIHIHHLVNNYPNLKTTDDLANRGNTIMFKNETEHVNRSARTL